MRIWMSNGLPSRFVEISCWGGEVHLGMESCFKG